MFSPRAELVAGCSTEELDNFISVKWYLAAMIRVMDAEQVGGISSVHQRDQASAKVHIVWHQWWPHNFRV